MGLSSKQVSSRGLDWNQTLLEAQNLELPKANPMRKQQQQQQQQQQQTQQLEAVKCPRCDSSNTKFCYYNNYNKSQPRHFCRACKRHWTKGGTLRNVPVGGGRKNKRVKKSTSPTSATITPTNSISTTPSNANMTTQTPQQRKNLPTLAVSDQRSIPSSSLYESMIHPPSLLPQPNLMRTRDSEGKDFGIGNGIFLSSSLPFPQNQSHLFPFSNSTSFDSNTCAVSISLPSSNAYNYVEEFKIMEEPTINSIMASTSGTITQPWEMPATSTGMEMSNYWSWEDIDSLVSTDLNAPWDDSDIKP